MYSIKKNIFNDLTKNQKSDFLSFVKFFVKSCYNFNSDIILNNLLAEIECSRDVSPDKYSYIDINSDANLKQISLYISACKNFYQLKEAQQPLIQEQKRIQKEYNAKLKIEKQKREIPTKKQIAYYSALIKKAGLEPKNVENLSKYDIKLEIENLVKQGY